MGESATFQEAIRQYCPGYSMPQRFYADPNIFEMDLDRIYRRHWLLAGPTCRVPPPGDYFTYQIANDSIVILRDEAEAIRAHHDVCRHRGSRICLEEQGHAKRLVCPYRNWSYDLNGMLCSARHLPEEYDRHQIGLHPVGGVVGE